MQAQTDTSSLVYSLDTIRLDSFYIIETYTVGKANMRPNVSTTPQLFRDTSQVRLYISNLRNDSRKAYDQAYKYEQAARIWELKASAIEQLVNKSSWFMGTTLLSNSEKKTKNKK